MPKIVLPVIFILASIAGFFLYINPQYAIVKENRAQLAKINDAVKKADQLKAIRDKLMLERDKITPEDMDRISKMIPDGVENIGLIIEMNNIAHDMGLELLNPSIGNVSTASNAPSNGGSAVGSTGLDIGPDSKKFGQLSMSFTVNTTYEKFIAYAKELERSLRLVDITDVKFGQPDAKTGKMNFSITIQTYWLK